MHSQRTRRSRSSDHVRVALTHSCSRVPAPDCLPTSLQHRSLSPRIGEDCLTISSRALRVVAPPNPDLKSNVSVDRYRFDLINSQAGVYVLPAGLAYRVVSIVTYVRTSCSSSLTSGRSAAFDASRSGRCAHVHKRKAARLKSSARVQRAGCIAHPSCCKTHAVLLRVMNHLAR